VVTVAGASLERSRVSASHLPWRKEPGTCLGNYITDFCAPSKKLIIELDGSQHLEQEEYDAERTAFLKSKGYRVLCFYNNDVIKNIDKVMEVILENIES